LADGVDVLVAQLPARWPAPDDPLDWCPRVEVLSGRRPPERARSLGADRLLSVLCTRWQVARHWYEPDGRPSCGPGAYLTASHDGTYVAAGIAGRPIGVDVVDCQRNTAWLVKTMSDDERDCGTDEQARARSWAVREAALKWAGVGFAVGPRTLTVTCCPDPTPLSWSGASWWTVRFPDGRTVPVVARTTRDCALALAVQPPVTMNLDDHELV